MRFIRMLLMRARALVRSGAVDHELGHEIHEHLEHLVEDYIARGMSLEAAREAARREFGPLTQIVEESRDARGVMWLANAWQDIKYGIRLMRRTPGFAAAATLTVALGIGATTAMFSVVYGVVLQPLPYREPDRLVNLWSTAIKRGLPRANVGMANVYDWRARNHVFEDIAALRAVANFNLTGQGEPERLNGSRVSSNLFPVLGVTPLVGRTFTEDEDAIGHEHVAILTYGLWVRRFGADSAIVGRTIALNGEPHTVVGVMRPDFAYPTREFQIYTPLTFDPQELVNRMNYSYLAVARLKPGVSTAQAQAEMTVLSAQIELEHPRENEGIGAEVVPTLDDAVSTVRTPLYILLAAVAAMLLIGCANLTNLLVARALVRQRELAVRSALGAARARLIMQSIGELAPMLAAGGVLGLLGAAWIIDVLVPLLPADVPRVENVGLHLPVLLCTAATLAAIALGVGVWPALEASRGGLRASVADLSRGNTGAPAHSRVRDVLVVVQIAATLWLVVGAALLMRSFGELRQVHPGFNPERVYSLHLAIPRSKYPTDRDIAAFGDRILERVRTLPDVVSAGLVNRLPLAGGTQTGGIEIEGIDPKATSLGNVDYRSVTPDYFRTLEIPLSSGRSFTETDTEMAPLVAIIDERLARSVLAAGADPIGRRVRIPVLNLPWLTIVGVAGHIRHDRLDQDTRPQIYFPYKQRTQDRMALAVRTRTDPATIGGSLVAVIRGVDPEQPVYDARTLEAVVDRSVAQRWLQTVLLGSFAAIALILASIGVYGVIAYAVGQRQREFGIRLALGAKRAEIVALVMRRGALLLACGAVIGLAAAIASARVLSTLLFNVTAFDPLSFGVATLVMLAVAVAACGLPARRAASVDPSLALRAE
jgi:putative ABC transport system permease protein